jgi:type I restriction enzyme R subunit
MNAQTLEDYEQMTGESIQTTMRRLKNEPPDDMAAWVRRHAGVGQMLDWNSDTPSSIPLPISEHHDSVYRVWTGYGDMERPEDFLDAFSRFVRDNVNKIAALQAVVQRPRELTRADLKTIRAELDRNGFSEANLHRAWLEAKNEDIAAPIVSYIRQAALGDPLRPFADRVNAAIARITARHAWSDPQRKWLERIGKAVIQVGVIDQGVLDEGQFKETMGGFARLNKVFDGKLGIILGDINEEIWKKSA